MTLLEAPVTSLAQHRVRVRGVVQGVGFRPWIWRLAHEHGLRGWVRNDAEGVEILLQGEHAAIAAFALRLEHEAPPLARIDTLHWASQAPQAGLHDFAILASAHHGTARTLISHDSAVCPDCLAEIFDPN
ncbi:Acylphosphatase domain protein, partial [mine drainage metagenome]